MIFLCQSIIFGFVKCDGQKVSYPRMRFGSIEAFGEFRSNNNSDRYVKILKNTIFDDSALKDQCLNV